MEPFYSLALDIAEDMGYMRPAPLQEVILWRAVIVQAIRDALGKTKGGLKPIEAVRNKKDAERWFCEGDKDFQTVCAYADLQPKAVQYVVLDFLTDPNPDRELFNAI